MANLDKLVILDEESEFGKGRVERLNRFRNELFDLFDEYHSDIYLRDDLWVKLKEMQSIISDEIREPKILKYRK
jgi:predicted choloylglycine hydrolase